MVVVVYHEMRERTEEERDRCRKDGVRYKAIATAIFLLKKRASGN